MMKYVISLSLLASLFLFSSTEGLIINADDAASISDQTVVGVLQSHSDLSDFNKLVIASGISQELEGMGPFTVFAPSNRAFQNLPKTQVEEFLKKENLYRLQEFVKNHVVSGNLTTDKINQGTLKALSGKSIDVNVRGSQIKVGGAEITQPDNTASNGVVQIVDKVILKSNNN